MGLGPTTPPFTQCPGVGADTSCAVLIIFNPDGTVTVKNDPSQGPFDSIEDTLVGVQNNLSSPVFSISISGNSIFSFDGDGLCSYITCTWAHPTGYEGPGVSFSVTNGNTGRVNFANGIPLGGSGLFQF